MYFWVCFKAGHLPKHEKHTLTQCSQVPAEIWHLLPLTHCLAGKGVKHVWCVVSIEGFEPHLVLIGDLLALRNVLGQQTRQLRYFRCT